MLLGYFADGPWSHNALEKIIKDERYKIAFICARFSSDKFLEKRAFELGIDFIKNINFNSIEFIKIINSYKCDIFLTIKEWNYEGKITIGMRLNK